MRERGPSNKTPGGENRLAHFVCNLLSLQWLPSLTIQILRTRSFGTRMLELRVKLHRPLVDINFATALLGRGRKEVMALIETGEILWAWNLNLSLEMRPFVRIYAQSIADYLEKRPAPKIDSELQFELITRQIFQGHSKTINGVRLKRALGVGSDHVHHLWHAGLLRTAPGSRCYRGVGGSPVFELSSAVEFLSKRRLA